MSTPTAVLTHERGPTHRPAACSNFTRRQIELFAIRASQVAERVFAGQMAFLDGVDMCFSAAEWSGLVDAIGVDDVQRLMAAAFSSAREPKGDA
jgi:hypothetical protein